MVYISTNSLDNNIIMQLETLSDEIGYEPYFSALENSYHNAFHYYMENGQILSFIGLMPVKSASGNTVELTGFTCKTHRHMGLFSSLLKNALTELSDAGINHIISSHNFSYSFINSAFSHSEYLMTLNLSDCDSKPNSLVEDNTNNNIEILEYVYDYDLYEEWIYVLLVEGIACGMLKFTVDNNTACLNHVFIRKSFRSKGYGKRLLIGALNMFSTENPYNILLHVSSTNTVAVKLYKSLNFEITESLDYFELRLEEAQ